MSDLPVPTYAYGIKHSIEEKDLDIVVQSDHNGPVAIKGVAYGRDRNNSKNDAYFVVYKVGKHIHRAPISKRFHTELRTLIANIKEVHMDEVNEWIMGGGE